MPEGCVPEADGVIAAVRKHMTFMPLELFDNLDYESHEPQEWVDLGKDKGVSSIAVGLCAIPHMALTESGQAQWH